MSEHIEGDVALAQPRIAISHAVTSPSATALLREVLPPLIETTVQSVQRFGGIARVFDAAEDADQPRAGQDFDALIVLGGGDVDPAAYGQAPMTDTLYGVDAAVDEHQMSLVRSSITCDVPVLGICRGMQIIAAAMGGTLIQDLGEGTPHKSPDDSIPFAQHGVDLLPDSGLFHLYGGQAPNVYSAHHQAVDGVPPGFVVAATGPDDVIEAIELDHPWVLGVQWHPEADPNVEDSLDVLVGALVRAAGHDLPDRPHNGEAGQLSLTGPQGRHKKHKGSSQSARP